MANENMADRPHVVIVGGGFGGLEAAKALRHADVRVTIVDRTNHYLFQPLLYQVATAGLASTEIAAPIRALVRGNKNTRVVMGEVTGVDSARRILSLQGAGDLRELPYDYLVLATGARHAYFGHDEWAPFAPGLKDIEDARSIRERILSAFEAAEVSTSPEEAKSYLTFVLVGAGPTGVEMSGAIAELARRALAKDFRKVDPRSARVVLVEAGDRVLSAFPPALGERARRKLESFGVHVMLNARVTSVDEAGVSLASGERIAARTVIWAAGVQASPAGTWLNVETDRAGRVNVLPDCSVPGLPEVFVIGDASHFEQDGKPLPGVSPVAMQQGRYVAKVIAGRASRRVYEKPFRYFDKGNLATVGRLYAVGFYRNIAFTGVIAWLVWAIVHIYYLIGFRNRLIVLVQWVWAYLTYQRGARVITTPAAHEPIAALPTSWVATSSRRSLPEHPRPPGSGTVSAAAYPTLLRNGGQSGTGVA